MTVRFGTVVDFGQKVARFLEMNRHPKSNRVLLVIYTHPEWHSTLIFTSQILCEHGFEVDIVCKDTSKRDFLGPVDFGSRARLHAVKSLSPRWAMQLSYLVFIGRVAHLAFRQRPRWVIGYDLFGFAAACVGAPGIRRIYHNFDLSVAHSGATKALVALEHARARRAHQVVVSSTARARIFQSEARLARPPVVVMNCQRLKTTDGRTGELRHRLRAEGITADRIVLRLGSIDPGHGIDATIRSVRQWDSANWLLVLAGSGSDRFLTELRHLVRELQLESRVLLLPNVPRDLWYDCLYAAHLGISLYEPGNINHASMAGAGNKLNLYLKAGIPSIIPALPDFEAFTTRHGASEVAQPTDPGSIAEAVNLILRDEENYQRYCRQARQAFESEYNFEKQFRPILMTLLETVSVSTGKALLHE